MVLSSDLDNASIYTMYSQKLSFTVYYKQCYKVIGTFETDDAVIYSKIIKDVLDTVNKICIVVGYM